MPATRRTAEPLDRQELPEAWRKQFWSSPSAQSLLRLSPRELADLVPVQAGLRFCRCPACGADERDEPLAWSPEQPRVLKCRRCGVVVPNDTYPAKVNKEIPEETVEVLPGVVHHYPYHAVEEGKARYPDERLYLRARCDYEARKYLARTALYAASESRSRPVADRDPRMAVLACVIMLRFAQVYPGYAIHSDQPAHPKSLQPARLQPPFRRGYRTAKWEWTGCLEVPLNLVMASTLLRDDPAWGEAGKLLADPSPEQTVRRDLFLAAAEFSRAQPEEYSEDSVHVYRGLLAVGRLLADPGLKAEAAARLDGFVRRGFYHDGFWRQAEIGAHRRILGLLDGWGGGAIAPEAGGTRSNVPLPPRDALPGPAIGTRPGASASGVPVIELARKAGSALGDRGPSGEVQQASWPSTVVPAARRPILLGGAGIARLALGHGPGALDIELCGVDSFSGPHFQRLALRLSVAGQPVLDDLDERGETATGWELATASHNAVVVDGLNQRETPVAARSPAPGGDFLFFAADPDFQVVMVQDPRAYPQSTTRYRHTVIGTSGASACYALSVFQVAGGLQHDQIYHAASGRGDRWVVAGPPSLPPPTLLPASITFLPSARPDQGRWFVQAFGELLPDSQARWTGPALATLVPADPASPVATVAGATEPPPSGHRPGLRLHVLGDTPITAITARSPDPSQMGTSGRGGSGDHRRASLILRRRSREGEQLSTTYVSLFEPVDPRFPPLGRVGRVTSSGDVVVVFVETADGPEYLAVNLEPATPRRVALPNGRYVSFDGLAVRVRESGLALAGGSFAEGSGKLVSQARLAGSITASVRRRSERGLGWFVTTDRLPDDAALAGRTLTIRHGDGTCRSWTLDSIESGADGTRLHVREEPGFVVDPADGAAHYYQFPRLVAPGPHRFHLSQIAR